MYKYIKKLCCFKNQIIEHDYPMHNINKNYKIIALQEKIDLLFDENEFDDNVKNENIEFIINTCFFITMDLESKKHKVMCNICCEVLNTYEYLCPICNKKFLEKKCSNILHILYKYELLYKQRYNPLLKKHMKCIISYQSYIDILYDKLIIK